MKKIIITIICLTAIGNGLARRSKFNWAAIHAQSNAHTYQDWVKTVDTATQTVLDGVNKIKIQAPLCPSVQDLCQDMVNKLSNFKTTSYSIAPRRFILRKYYKNDYSQQKITLEKTLKQMFVDFYSSASAAYQQCITVH